jgi:hypothetical protein
MVNPIDPEMLLRRKTLFNPSVVQSSSSSPLWEPWPRRALHARPGYHATTMLASIRPQIHLLVNLPRTALPEFPSFIPNFNQKYPLASNHGGKCDGLFSTKIHMLRPTIHGQSFASQKEASE